MTSGVDDRWRRPRVVVADQCCRRPRVVVTAQCWRRCPRPVMADDDDGHEVEQ